MMRVVDLRKSFLAPNGERIEVLHGVTFAANAGESIAITGVSGSGKSTLLHLLGGLEAADHGFIDFDGNNIQRQQIGFVFQFHYLLADLSALENVALPLLIARQKSERAFSRALNLLTEAGLKARADHPVSHLSGGEQQRVAVARALVTEPKLLLADEPTGNLDEAISEEISRTIVNYAHQRSAIAVIATHSARLARLCDRVLMLDGGCVKPSQKL
ncbi:MAG TPA: ABC transporter ATP-binding protein [Pyrinomonadaceae bacterium]|nr:ABC transporter ATP-binding protein [Pyrinomonadaceae bacterium]